MTKSRYLDRLFLVAAIAAQVGTGIFGAWMLDDLGRRYDEATLHRVQRVDAMIDLHASLTDAERMILITVIQGERLHPDVPASFRACIIRAREACRAGRAGTDYDGEEGEAARLANSIEDASNRGETLLASPAFNRLSLYSEPADGFQSSVTSAWRHLSKIRTLNEVLLEEAATAARTASRRAAWLYGAVSVLSLGLSLFAWWRWRRISVADTPVDHSLGLPSYPEPFHKYR
jgi:hypothetical protein